jgi:hypothetical protein
VSKKFYKLHCETCNWNRVTDGSDITDLYRIKTAPIPGGVQSYDFELKKRVDKPSRNQPKKFRCPNCGRVVVPRQIKNPQEKIDQHLQEIAAQKLKKEWDTLEIETKKRYLDAKKEYEQEQNQLDGN